MYTGIYCIQNKLNNKIYIGSCIRSFRERFNEHKHYLRNNKHHSIFLQRSWNKYGEDKFEFKIIEYVPKEECVDNKYLLDIEQMYLDTYQPEYNMRLIAESNLGHKWTIEQREKHSKIFKGRTLTNEHSKNISLANKGRIHSEETKIKISLAQSGEKSYNYGKPRSNETKKKISDFRKGIKPSEKQMEAAIKSRVKTYKITHPDNRIEIITNLSEFCRNNKLSIGNMCSVARGDRTHHKNYKCEHHVS